MLLFRRYLVFFGTMDRHRGDNLAWFGSGDSFAETIHHPNQIPAWRKWHSGGFWMHALASHYVGQGDACGQHSHPHFIMLRLRAFFFEDLKGIRPAVVSDDDTSVSHGISWDNRASPAQTVANAQQSFANEPTDFDLDQSTRATWRHDR